MDAFLQIAARIRELREICGYEQSEIAADLGIPFETYAAYEANGQDIPISVLYHLSHKYKVDMTEILTGNAAHLSSYHVVKNGHGMNVDRYPGYSFQNLAFRFANKVMEPMLVNVEPSDKSPSLVTHGGQEFNYVTEGEIEFLIDDKSIILGVGDSVYFDPLHPHGQRAFGDKPAQFLTVITEG